MEVKITQSISYDAKNENFIESINWINDASIILIKDLTISLSKYK